MGKGVMMGGIIGVDGPKVLGDTLMGKIGRSAIV